jgi:alcohol dehydrogenase class IV
MSWMTPLRKFVAPEFIFGRGARTLAGRYASNFGGNRVLIVTDPGVIAAGWVAEVRASLEEAGLVTEEFCAVSANPRAEEVTQGAEIYRSRACDIIVAVGGGSPIDCAKGISVVSTNQGHILSFEGIDKVGRPGPPLICIPTTAGTAADVSQFAIISDRQALRKIAIISKAVVPDVSLIDPETTTTMDSHLTICTGLDALVHAVEAFVSRAHSPILDIHALEAIRLIRENLQGARRNPNDLERREDVMRAALHAGIAFSNASLGAVHAMSHSLGGLLDLPHGESNALLLEHVMAFNYEAAPERYDRIGEALGLDLRGMPKRMKMTAIRNDIEHFKRNLGLDGGLVARGVHYADVANLARNALVDACLVTNPRQARQRDMEVIYEEAM